MTCLCDDATTATIIVCSSAGKQLHRNYMCRHQAIVFHAAFMRFAHKNAKQVLRRSAKSFPSQALVRGNVAMFDEEAATKFETKAQVEKINKKKDTESLAVFHAAKCYLFCFVARSFHNNFFLILRSRERQQRRKKMVKPEAMLQHTQILYNEIAQCALNSKIHHARKNCPLLCRSLFFMCHSTGRLFHDDR
jgi:hypothetical protein